MRGEGRKEKNGGWVVKRGKSEEVRNSEGGVRRR